MKLFIITIMVIAGLQGGAIAAEESKIYKSTDESGNPVFSDEATEGAEEITVEEPATFSSDTLMQQYDQFTRSPDQDQDSQNSYQRLAITSPANDQTIRSNPGDFQVNFDVSPSPREGHTLQLVMDGKVYQQIDGAGPIQLTNVDRGTHKLQLQVTDSDNQVLQKGPAVTIHLLRHSIRHPQGRKSQSN